MSKVDSEIYSIQSELNQIVNELNNISAELKSNFNGIGEDKCANKISEQSRKYKKAISALNNINTNKYREGYGPNAKN